MRFRVKAVGSAGIVSVTLDAADSAEAMRIARERGLRVLGVRRSAGSLGLPGRRSRFPLTLFTQELHALLHAGLGPIEALEALSARRHAEDSRDVLLRVLGLVREGKALSVAFDGAEGAFPPIFVALIRAAERTGDLEEALSRYLAYQARIDELRNRLVTTAIYPAVLMVVGGSVILFLLGYVVPRIAGVYADAGSSNMPLASQWLLGAGRFVNDHWLGSLGTVGLLVAVLVVLAADSRVRATILSGLWRIPTIGERMRVYQLARLYRTLGMLQRAGIAIARALEMSGDLLSPALRVRMAAALRDIREGRKFSDATQRHGLSTEVGLRMLRVGERTGDLGRMLEQIAEFHDSEFARSVERFTRLFEPLLMAFIGIVIGAIVVLLYMPIFDLASTLQ
jgi:general secretion pathway protein F